MHGMHYKHAFNKCFHRICRLIHGIPISYKKYGLKHNNNPIERYNEDARARQTATSNKILNKKYHSF